MKKKLFIFTMVFFFVFLIIYGGNIIMTDYNIQMGQRNSENTEWDNHYPITKASNVVMQDGSTIDSLSTVKADTAYVDTQIAAVASGSPKGVYATLTALQTAFPTGTTGIYIVELDGKWYYWNGTAWTAGGVYQSSSLPATIEVRNKYTNQSLITDFPANKITFTSVNVAGGSGFPYNTAGLLITYRYVGNGWDRQEFKPYVRNEIWNRYVASDETWTEWKKIAGDLQNEIESSKNYKIITDNTGLNNASPITAFPINCISSVRFSIANNAGFPTIAGTLETNRTTTSTDYNFQIWYDFGSNKIYKRRVASGVWQEWEKISLVSLFENEILNYELNKKADKENCFFRDTTKGLVTFIDDDGYEEVYTVLKPIFEAKGAKCVVAQITSGIDVNGRLSTEQLLDLQNNLGWEIASHTVNHVRLTDVDLQTKDLELRESYNYLRQKGIQVESIVYPNGAHDAEVRKVVSKYYRCGVAGGGGANLNLPLKQFALNRVAFGSLYEEGQGTLEFYKSKVDEAKDNNGWTIFMTHATATDSTQLQYLSDTIQYCIDNDVPIVTLKEGLDRLGNIVQLGDNTENPYDGKVIGADFKTNTGDIICYPIDSANFNASPFEMPKNAISKYPISVAFAAIAENNVPQNTAGILTVETFGDDVIYYLQTYRLQQSNTVYARYVVDGVWTTWELE